MRNSCLPLAIAFAFVLVLTKTGTAQFPEQGDSAQANLVVIHFPMEDVKVRQIGEQYFLIRKEVDEVYSSNWSWMSKMDSGEQTQSFFQFQLKSMN